MLELLANGDPDTKKMVAYHLGERRVRDAVPALAKIALDRTQDINLRHNAALSLGEICASPCPAGTDVDLAVTTLIAALDDRDEFFPYSVIDGLERIGDSRAIAPLEGFIADTTRSPDAREKAARSLDKIRSKIADSLTGD